MAANLTYRIINFRPNWRMMALALVAMAFFIYLGVWQLQRGADKQAMIAAKALMDSQIPSSWLPKMENPKPYKSVIVEGHFLPKVFLLDNQHYEHQFGYHVLSPLELGNKKIVLIDRGWMSGDSNRQNLPEVINPKERLSLAGQVYFPSDKNWVLGPVLEKKSVNLAIIELIDTQIVSQFLHKSVYPFIIRLDKAEPNGYVRDWKVVSMSPERHQAYALQWFAMAFVVLVIFIGLTMKKSDENCKT